MIHIGIDYSMTCPAVCIFSGEDTTDPDNFEFHYLAPNKKYEGSFENGFITGWMQPTFTSQEERFDKISEWVLMLLTNAGGHEKGLNSDFNVTIEGYSMGSKGKVFHIAENAGLLKHKLYKKHIAFDTPAPTTVKKFATGKGNANKERMYECFEAETGWDLESLLGCNRDKNPISDIVDSYYMCMYGYKNNL
jgi:Holliday junction resolvasome RuvABC endonuclease subunit